ncbi:MAG: TetR/AcrR family transcriptional regulator [Actinomycetota bacterium]|nr:TetR/AcrR family transcriptional regulator [Actinomycetota bacterium]
MVQAPAERAEWSAPGRPRDEVREQAILDAAVELLTEVGYDRFSIDTLAARARASKATIYRRWSNKAEVVLEAVRRLEGDHEEALPDQGSLREDLLEFMGCIAKSKAPENAALVAGLVRAMHSDPELNELMHCHVMDQKRAEILSILERSVARGELASAASAPVAVEVLQAMLLGRLVLDGAPLDGAFLVHLVDDVVLPLLRCPPSDSRGDAT